VLYHVNLTTPTTRNYRTGIVLEISILLALLPCDYGARSITPCAYIAQLTTSEFSTYL